MIDNSKIVETGADGLTVYRDDVDPKVVYLIPSQPQFRRDESGRPVFSFVKYFNGDEIAGAYCVFDVELSATDEQRARVKRELGDVRFASPHYVDGSASLLISSDTTLVQLVVNASKPSLVGKNITSFNAKLTAAGAQVFEAAMSRKAGHIVQVKYDLTAPARFGGVTIEISYDATKIATFLEQISSGGRAGLAKRIDQAFQDTKIAQVTINNEDSKLTEAAKDANRTWAQNLLATQLSNELNISADIGDDERKRFEELARTDAAQHHVVYRGWFWYWYVEQAPSNAQLSKNVQSIRKFSAKFTENSAHDWIFNPQGALPAITALTDAAGAPLKWEDYRSEVRLGSDDFFRQVQPNIYVNADWDRLNIDSVIVNVWYPNKPGRPNRQSHVFRAPAQNAPASPFKCSFAYDRDDKTLDFGYQFEVHFVGYSESYKSEDRTGNGDTSIDVGDLGALAVDILPDADLWQGEAIKSVSMEIQYDDPARKTVVYRPGTLVRPATGSGSDSANPPAPLKFFQPLTSGSRVDYRWSAEYHLNAGGSWKSDPMLGTGRTLSVPYPFVATQKVTFSISDDKQIEWVELTPTYSDPAKKYSVQGTSKRFKPSDDMWDWPVAVMSMTGTLACEMVVRYREDSGKKPRMEHLNTTTPWKDGEFITIPDDLRTTAPPTLNRKS